MKLTVVITQGEERLVGQVQEIPGVLTQGENVEEVMENVQDALELYFQESKVVPERTNVAIDSKDIVSTQELEFA